MYIQAHLYKFYVYFSVYFSFFKSIALNGIESEFIILSNNKKIRRLFSSCYMGLFPIPNIIAKNNMYSVSNLLKTKLSAYLDSIIISFEVR